MRMQLMGLIAIVVPGMFGFASNPSIVIATDYAAKGELSSSQSDDAVINTNYQSISSYSWDEKPGESIGLLRGKDVVWRFNFGQDLNKPYFHPLALSKEQVLTLDKPADHIWHHGLWFSWKLINGVNYWEVESETGKPAGRTSWSPAHIETHDDYSATITMDLTYQPVDGEAVLIEKRQIKVTRPNEDGTFNIDWASTFTATAEHVKLDRTPLPNEPGGRIYGGYAGLSLRMVNLDDREVTTMQGQAKFNEQDRFRTKSGGLDYSGLNNSEVVGVSILDHPDNLNTPSPWYVIRSSVMTFFTPAVICYGPHEMTKGETFSLQYRITIHKGRWDAERLQKQYNSFVEGSDGKGSP